MPDSEDQSGMPPDSPTGWYSYAIIRVVPRVERGECLNVGVVLFARELGFLDAHVELPTDRLLALAPDADLLLIRQHLDAFCAVARGEQDGGPMAGWPPSERFHWLTAPRSTVIQTSPVHVGVTDDPASALNSLMDALVRISTPSAS